jgi:hypothetical protein
VKIKKHLNFTSLRKKASEIFERVSDWRQQGKIVISIHDAMMSGLACMYFQDPSLLQFQKRMQEEQHRNNLSTLFGVEDVPKETQMREIIDGVSSEYFRPLFRDYYLRLQRGKHLDSYSRRINFCPRVIKSLLLLYIIFNKTSILTQIHHASQPFLFSSISLFLISERANSIVSK